MPTAEIPDVPPTSELGERGSTGYVGSADLVLVERDFPTESPARVAERYATSALLHAHDWSTTALVARERWPHALTAVVDLVLGSPLAMIVLWGPELVQIYNDAYAEIAGAKHPRGFGQRTRECWPEVWHFNAPVYEAVFAGMPQSFTGQKLTIERRGRPEDAWFDLTYSPLRDEAGSVAGILCVVVETTGRVLAERRIAGETARQRRLFERAPGFVSILRGPDFVFEFVNDAYARLSGGRDLIGRTVREAFPDLVGQGFFESLEKAYATGERFIADGIPIRLHHSPGADEEARFLDFIYEPVKDETGVVTGIFIQGHDVTDAHLTRQALRATERRQAFRISLDEALWDLSDPRVVMAMAAETLGRHLGAARCGYGEVDATGEFITIEADWTDGRMASAAGRLRLDDFGVGLIAEARAGRAIRMVDARTDARVGSEGIEAHLALGSAFASLTVPLVKEGRLLALLYVNQADARHWTDEDETLVREVGERTWSALERARVEAALRASKEKLRDLNADLERQVIERTRELSRTWKISPDLLGVLDPEGFFQVSNPAWQKLLGWSEDELRRTEVFALINPDDLEKSLAAFETMKVGKPILRFENRYRDRDGGWHWLSWVAVPEGGKFYCSARDVTADKERDVEFGAIEEQLHQAQKMEAIGQLTGGVAHDFNNLLTIIKSSTDLLRRPDLAEDRRRRYVDAISDTVDRAAKLTGQLLAFARRQSLKPEVFDVGDRVRGVADMLRTIAGSRILIEIDAPCGEGCVAEADTSQFETALVNLAVNARDAMDGEGVLTLRVHPVDETPAIRGHVPRTGPFVAVSLSDTGSGIEDDRLNRIFEPFYTTKEVGKGTGLGLSQVFGFVKQSGGEVAVESDVGRGTTFVLYLPRVEARVCVDEQASREPAEGDTGDGRRILVVEDNVDVGSFSTQLLQDLGYETTWAENGQEALLLLEAGKDDFDVVFSDVIMPGMSGVELGHEIRKRYPRLPVVLTSGYSHVLAEEGRHGFELVQKPYAVEELSRVLDRVMRMRVVGRAPRRKT